MDFIKKNIWLILFVLWGLPLSYYRSKFRKIVYQTDSWLINIKPYFIKEIKGLFGTLYPKNQAYIKFRNFYLFYLLVYFQWIIFHGFYLLVYFQWLIFNGLFSMAYFQWLVFNCLFSMDYF